MNRKKEVVQRLGEYEQLEERLATLDRAMETLTPEERMVADRLLLHRHKGSWEELCRLLNMEKTTVYRRRESAIKKVAVALFGPEEEAQNDT